MNQAASWTRVAGRDELPDGTLKAVTAGGKGLVLARMGDRYCALADRCPHAGGPLSEGILENGRILCPWHGREIDLATGECAGLPSVDAFPVDVRADGVFVAV